MEFGVKFYLNRVKASYKTGLEVVKIIVFFFTKKARIASARASPMPKLYCSPSKNLQ